jgi:hypothetical protein
MTVTAEKNWPVRDGWRLLSRARFAREAARFVPAGSTANHEAMMWVCVVNGR